MNSFIKERRFCAVTNEKWIAYHIDKVDYPSGFSQKIGLRRIVFDKSCLRHILLHQKIWPVAHFCHKHFPLKHSVVHLFSSFLYCLPILLVVRMIQTPILRDNTSWSQRHTLHQTLSKNCRITNLLSNQTSWNTNLTAPIQFQNSL